MTDTLVKQTHYCVRFIALWSKNCSFQTPQSFQIFCSDVDLWSIILGNVRKRAILKISGRIATFALSLFYGVTICDKEDSCIYPKASDVKPLLQVESWVYEAVRRGGEQPTAWAISGQTLFSALAQSCSKIPIYKKYIFYTVNSGHTLFFKASASCSKIQNGKSIFSTVKLYRANSVFQGKRKLLKNPERWKNFQYSVYSLRGDPCNLD